MNNQTPPNPKTELEQKYEAALETIAGGKSWQSIVAKAALDKDRGPLRRIASYLKDNLAAIASLAIALSGISFGILQYISGQSLRKREITIAKVEALQKLVPSLTSENPDTRKYALSALFTLYSDDSSSTDDKESRALLEQIGQVGDVETVEAISRKLPNDIALKKRAAELYAIRAEQNRHDAAVAETPDQDKSQQNYLRARQYLDASWSDTRKALSIDPENAKAIYQLGRLLMDDRRDYKAAGDKFSHVIKLIDENKYPRDDEIYPRSYLNRMLCLYLPDKKITAAVCEAYKLAKIKYPESDAGKLDVAGENLEDVANGCP